VEIIVQIAQKRERKADENRLTPKKLGEHQGILVEDGKTPTW